MRLDHEKVRWHRDRLGWTLDTLAEKAEVAKGTVLRAEHGEDVRPSSGRRIARALGTEISDLIPEKPGRVEALATAGPLAETPREAGRPQTLEIPYMTRPEIREWLAEQGHMSPDEFRSYVENLDLDIDEVGWPRGLERAINELRQTRDKLIAELKKPTTRGILFPRRSGLSTEEERIREALRPAGEAWKLEREIRHEYLTRQVDLINHGRRLHAEGVTGGHLEYQDRLDAMEVETLAEAGAA